MDPVTIALVGAAGLSAIGKLFGGSKASKAAKDRALALEEGARQRLRESGMEASLGLEDDDRLEGTAAVRAAAGGGGGLRGSAMDVLADLERQSLFKAKSTIYRGLSEARNMITEAKAERKDGKNAKISSYFSAGGSLLSGFASAAARGG